MNEVERKILGKVTGYKVRWVKNIRVGSGPRGLLGYSLREGDKYNLYLRWCHVTLQTYIITGKIFLRVVLRYNYYEPSVLKKGLEPQIKKTSEDFYREMEFVVEDPYCITGQKTIVRLCEDNESTDFNVLYEAFGRLEPKAIDTDAIRRKHRSRNVAMVLKYLE